MKLSQLKIDATRAEQGDWVDNLPDMGNLRLKVRGFGNQDFTRALAKATRAVPRKERDNGSLDPVTLDTIMSKLMVDHILLDWDGLLGDDDQPVPYSKEQAALLLMDPDFRPFRNAVSAAAERVEMVEQDSREEAAGNSPSA